MQASEEVLTLRDSLLSLERERDLQQKMDQGQLNSSPDDMPPVAQSAMSGRVGEKAVHEERLKWQVEMANVRREMEGEFDEERREWASTRETLKQEMTKLSQEAAASKGPTHEEAEQLQIKFKNSQQK